MTGTLASALIVALGSIPFLAGQSPPARALPASAEEARDALEQSPRHGEWVDVAVVGPSRAGADDDAAPGKIKTWIVHPERKDKAPVIIVIHEIFGLTDWVRAVADQFAAEGFIAVAPDLLSGKGPGGGGTDAFGGEGVREAIGKLSDDEVSQGLDAVRAYALKLPSASARSACIGFCWGGSRSFAYAAAQPELDAAVVFYGTAPQEQAKLAKISCPVLGVYGGDDARVTATVDQTVKTMTELGKSFTPHVYEGAGHGFLRQQSGRDGANLTAARQGWTQTLSFLRTHLKEPREPKAPDPAGG